MGRFFVRRAAHGLIVIFGVTMIVFVVTRMVGDPVQVMLPIDATAEQRDALRTQLGFDKPLPQQFVSYVGDLSRGDFGDSLWQRRSSLDVVLEKLPNTLRLTAAGMSLALLISVPLGILAALRPNTLLDRVASTTSLVGLSMPQFWLGLIFILLFAVQLGWFPTSGLGGWKHLVLPAVTLALPTAGRLAMLVRSTMIDELNRQWVRVARAKGMPFHRTVGMHALRNASVPVVTLAGWDLIRMLAGTSVIVEVVFAWPGIGFTALQAVERSDLILLQTIVFIVATITVVINVLMDVLYKFLDPRVKLT